LDRWQYSPRAVPCKRFPLHAARGSTASSEDGGQGQRDRFGACGIGGPTEESGAIGWGGRRMRRRSPRSGARAISASTSSTRQTDRLDAASRYSASCCAQRQESIRHDRADKCAQWPAAKGGRFLQAAICSVGRAAASGCARIIEILAETIRRCRISAAKEIQEAMGVAGSRQDTLLGRLASPRRKTGIEIMTHVGICR